MKDRREVKLRRYFCDREDLSSVLGEKKNPQKKDWRYKRGSWGMGWCTSYTETRLEKQILNESTKTLMGSWN